jgi:hypothetical protein
MTVRDAILRAAPSSPPTPGAECPRSAANWRRPGSRPRCRRDRRVPARRPRPGHARRDGRPVRRPLRPADRPGSGDRPEAPGGRAGLPRGAGDRGRDQWDGRGCVPGGGGPGSRVPGGQPGDELRIPGAGLSGAARWLYSPTTRTRGTSTTPRAAPGRGPRPGGSSGDDEDGEAGTDHPWDVGATTTSRRHYRRCRELRRMAATPSHGGNPL